MALFEWPDWRNYVAAPPIIWVNGPETSCAVKLGDYQRLGTMNYGDVEVIISVDVIEVVEDVGLRVRLYFGQDPVDCTVLFGDARNAITVWITTSLAIHLWADLFSIELDHWDLHIRTSDRTLLASSILK